jgi:hypothetical protein
MASSPGDHVRWFAEKQGWRIRRYNVMTEGEVDCRYFGLADKVYNAKHRQRLITDELAIFPVGTGLNGGALKIAEVFPTFHQLIERDLGENSQILFRAIALMDDDPVGREAYESITARSVRIRGGRDVFLLARSFPRIERMPSGYNAAIVNANKKWAPMNCEIEDLLPVEFVQQFLKANGIEASTCLQVREGAQHVELDAVLKGKLFQFCESNAGVEILGHVIDTLKSIRFYLGMPVPNN